MKQLEIHTERLCITEFTPEMAHSVCVQSLDADNRRFMPDEVFETDEIAAEVIAELSECYASGEGPLVYPILLNGQHIGHVEVVPLETGDWEIGYHVGEDYVRKGYASEAVRAFVPEIMQRLNLQTLYGICRAENMASRRVLEKCGFTLEYAGRGPYHGEETDICRYRK